MRPLFDKGSVSFYTYIPDKLNIVTENLSFLLNPFKIHGIALLMDLVSRVGIRKLIYTVDRATVINAEKFLPTIISTATLAVATRNIGATKASVLGVFEPVTAILVGTLVFGEPLTSNIVIGMTIAMVSVTFMITVTKR